MKTTRREIRKLKEMFPQWASPEAIIERIREEYHGGLSESDIYRNSTGEIVITLDCEHIIIFSDEDRPGLYVAGRMRTFEDFTTYSDASSGWEEFQGGPA